MRRYSLDRSVQRHGTVVLGGSPLTLFRLTPGGAVVVERIAAGEPVATSALVDRLIDAGAIHPVPDGAPFTADDVTIVMPTFGPPAHRPPGAVVVDDGSRPAVDDATIRLEVNRGPAAARNAGLATVTTPLVAFVDADVELPNGWLDPLLGHFADERVAVVAPRITTAPRRGTIARYERTHGPLDMGPDPARVRAGTRVSYLPAAVLVCRTDVIRSAGGFEESMRFGEDVDLVWRLDDAGWRVRYEPSVVIEHDPRSDWPGWVRQRIGYGSSAGPLAVRHRGRVAPLRMSAWSVVSWGLVAIGRPLGGLAIGIGSAAALVPKLADLPPAVAFRLAATGNLRAGEQIVSAVRRVWWPIVVLLALRSGAARRVLAVSFVAVRHPLRPVDDLAYSLGVWRGAIAARTVGPLVPSISSWPGRSTAEPPADAH